MGSVSADTVDEAVAVCGVAGRRSDGKLPPHVAAYVTPALSLPDDDYNWGRKVRSRGMASTETGAAAGGSVISLPSGGGAISGLGEKFAPDLFTGTGNFSVPISVPPGRHGLQPQLSLAYSTGTGNGPFGLGWALSLPGVSRKTSRGVPRYDADDVFIVSSAEDLVRVAGGGPGRQRYRPRTEGLFARIEHVQDAGQNYWEVRSKDGLVTLYGSPRPVPAPADWQDPATVRSPGGDRVCAWRITQTADLPGNVIRYRYRRDSAEPGHEGSQLLIDRIEYADYGDPAAPAFLIAVEFEYQARADPFSDRRAGFEVRTSSRGTAIRVVTHAASGVPRVAKEYRFGYQQAAFDGASLLTRVGVVGIDGDDEQALPPLTFGYSGFDPSRRRFAAVTGSGLPRTGLGDASLALVDLRGSGLPDIVELGAAHRYWPNLGEGRFGLPARSSRRHHRRWATLGCGSPTPTGTAARICWSPPPPARVTSR